jgi:hypothetical protein
MRKRRKTWEEVLNTPQVTLEQELNSLRTHHNSRLNRRMKKHLRELKEDTAASRALMETSEAFQERLNTPWMICKKGK